MGEEMRNKQIILKNYVKGSVSESNMSLRESTISSKIPDDAVLVKNLYLSCDPYMIGRMKNIEGYIADSFKIGYPINGYGVSKVLDSSHTDYKKGDLIWGITGWEEYTLIKDFTGVFKIQETDVPLSYYTGLLGKSL